MFTVLMSTGAVGGIIAGTIVGFILLVVIILLIWAIKKANYFRRMQIKIKESASDIDVALTKRFDLLTKQNDVVKGYTKHENSTLIAITQMRSSQGKTSNQETDMKKLSQFNADMDKVSHEISLNVERYPDLKANTLFLSLSNSCTDVEEHLQAARRLYNSNVSLYNQEIAVFPGSIVANHIHATSVDFFEAEEEKKQDVKLNF